MAFGRAFDVSTSGRGFTDITSRITEIVRAAEVAVGVAHVFVLHTSASLIVNENADPDVRRDLERFMSDLVPDGDPRFVHTAEGADDMAAHVRSVLTASSLTFPIREGRLALGTWQGVYLWEHRRRAHSRRVEVTVLP